MKTFKQFILEAYDPEVQGRSQIRRQGEGGRVGAQRKKTEPVDYKPRKDIGTSKPTSKTQQQPEKERGSAALSAKEAQKKAYRERKARERGEKTKTASELLTKKSKPKTDSKYKARKASGHTDAERKSITRKGERVLRDLRLKNLGKKKESELKHPISSSGYKGYKKKD